MKLVTVATKSDKYFPSLIESCKRNNYDITVLGWGQKWQGFTWRFNLMLEYLATLDDSEVVCFIDAYDVIMLQPSDILENKFIDNYRKTGKGIILTRDKALNPLFELGGFLSYGSCHGVRINAGTYIGFAGSIKDMLKSLCTDFDCRNPRADDQIFITKYCQKNYNTIDIDINANFFMVIVEGPNIDADPTKHSITFENGEIVYNKNVKPCVLHAPFQTNINTILQNIGYDGINITYDHMWKYIFVAHIHKFIFIIVFIIVLILIYVFYINLTKQS